MTSRVKELLAPLTESKLPVVYAKGSLRFRQIKCDNAQAGAEVNLEGGGGADFVFFDENSTATGATLTIDDESSSAKLPIGPLRGFRDLPCKRIFITCTAQSGKVLNLWYGKGVFLYGAQPAGKGQWYDRNLLSLVFRFGGTGVPPHGTTTRWTYTVPAARKAIVESANISVQRQTAAGAASTVLDDIVITPVAGGANTWYQAQIFTNGAGDTQYMAAGTQSTLVAGDNILNETTDLSTGGTVAYHAAIKVSEFDA